MNKEEREAYEELIKATEWLLEDTLIIMFYAEMYRDDMKECIQKEDYEGAEKFKALAEEGDGIIAFRRTEINRMIDGVAEIEPEFPKRFRDDKGNIILKPIPANEFLNRCKEHAENYDK